MINPFILSSVAEQVALQRYADQEQWFVACLALGGDAAALRAYDQDAARYAATTIYPNHLVVWYARRLGHAALTRGAAFPASVEQAIRDENAQAVGRLLNGRP